MTSDNEQVDKKGNKQGDEQRDKEVDEQVDKLAKGMEPAEEEGTEKYATEKQSYGSVAASKPAQSLVHPWTQVKYKNRKLSPQQSTKLPASGKYLRRRIIFPREISGHQVLEADLILALNEALQRAGKGLKTRFCRVGYSPLGAVSALLIKKANAGSITLRLSNVLIWATKTVDRP